MLLSAKNTVTASETNLLLFNKARIKPEILVVFVKIQKFNILLVLAIQINTNLPSKMAELKIFQLFAHLQ
jgi:hypothetical protein